MHPVSEKKTQKHTKWKQKKNTKKKKNTKIMILMHGFINANE